MDTVVDWLVELMRLIGAPGVGVATALETVFPPIPSELVLPLAGYTAYRGHYTLLSAVLWATVGSVVGAWLLYLAGRYWGVQRVRATADRLPLVDSGDVDRAMAWFARHGRMAVLFGRMVPGIRSLISIPAGVDRMPLGTFLLWTTIGSLVWNALLISGGYALGAQWGLVDQYVGTASKVVYVLIAIALVVFVARRLRHREQR
ncbi:DedA family protein [Nocardioides rotundus]|uniref:DedA family protein n=1 Tax=Nocardioides rotundus TaxID=1774216 RepID=UPI001CBFBA52|nr:DedA family protein [Nocardioides rotundus]UAL30758.1 DedA family protein [Nocardioides rotundus]